MGEKGLLSERYRFVKDGNGHWHCVTLAEYTRFVELLNQTEYDQIEEQFDDSRIHCGPEMFTFTDPRKER